VLGRDDVREVALAVKAVTGKSLIERLVLDSDALFGRSQPHSLLVAFRITQAEQLVELLATTLSGCA
jgi:hypothetical protein